MYNYSMDKEGVPVVKEKFWKALGTSTTYDDFEFDYAGNLYAVSNASKLTDVFTSFAVSQYRIPLIFGAFLFCADACRITQISLETTVKRWSNS